MNKKDFIEYYAEKLFNGDASLFLGAGVPASAGYPKWKDLLSPCAKRLRIDQSNLSLYLLAQYFANEYGYNELKKTINDNINILNDESPLLSSLTDLHFKTVWTTNYDKTLESNFSKRKILTNRIFKDKNLPNVDLHNRITIYKLNGDIDDLENIIITEDDIENYKMNHELLLTFFKRELVVNTFLFIGYSFTDRIVLSCLSQIKRCLGESSNYHIALLPNENTKSFEHSIKDLECRYHIKVLTFEHFEELPDILNELGNQVKKKNVFFSGVFERLEKNEDVFAKSLCKSLIEKLLHHNYKIVTGYGRNFGNYLSGAAIQYLFHHNMEIEKFLCMRPFLATMTDQEKQSHRELLIQNCCVSIFMFGQSPVNGEYVNSTGMLKEYEIAKSLNKYIIPIGCTGYTAKQIWEDMKANISMYGYLDKYINDLMKADPEKISKIVIQILEDIS